jgi:hypothetical protein
MSSLGLNLDISQNETGATYAKNGRIMKLSEIKTGHKWRIFSAHTRILVYDRPWVWGR